MPNTVKTLRNERYYEQHKNRIRQRRCQHYWDNPEKARSATRTYYQSHKEEYNEYRRNWRVQNPDKVKVQAQRAKIRNPEKFILRFENLKQWVQEQGGTAIFSARRRARMRGLLSTLTPEQWKAIKAAYRYRCAYCRQKKPLTQDHIIPAKKGGEHTIHNIVPACCECNSRKATGHPPTAKLRVLLF